MSRHIERSSNDDLHLVSQVARASNEEKVRNGLIEFAVRWQFSTLSERSGSQQHFCDLCDALGVPKPIDIDRTGEYYTFEKGVIKTGGGSGFADVWYKRHFAWEYKGKKKNLQQAYQQLLNYREDLENPPLLVVCDMDQFEVHTNFTDTPKRVYKFDLAELVRGKPTKDCSKPPIDVLRALWFRPEELHPGQTRTKITEKAAAEFGRLANSLRDRDVPPERAAHFLIQLLFCLFAEDIGLMGRHRGDNRETFSHLLEQTRHRPDVFRQQLNDLFSKMRRGGWYGNEEIRYFNGGLFDTVDVDLIHLSAADLGILELLAKMDWKDVEPAVLGTLFERGLDPAKRAQLGAHYTSKEDILDIVEPVLMTPLRREWAALRADAEALVTRRASLMRTASADSGASKYEPPSAVDIKTARQIDIKLDQMLQGFCTRLSQIQVLDAACGSGNFLYVALRELMDLERNVILFATSCGLNSFLPRVSVEQMHGIEINDYAAELASITIQIGYLQWQHENGFGTLPDPVLSPLKLIKRGDALLDYSNGTAQAANWPEADVVVGNPPFLGGNRLRQELGDAYVDDLFKVYAGQVPASADLVCYWFEQARALIKAGKVRRAGLLSTNSIRGGVNRRVLENIKETGDIFMAWSDRPWTLDGAAVRVSMIGFDDGTETTKTLDGGAVIAVNIDLTNSHDLTTAKPLHENSGIGFRGNQKGGDFDIPGGLAAHFLSAPCNPNGRPNSDVVRPSVNGLDITRRPRGVYIINFGATMSEVDAAQYEAPFEYVKKHVKPERDKNNRDAYRIRWWLHNEARPGMWAALNGLPRYIVTPHVSKHRIFVWLTSATVPDHQLIVFARSDDYFFGVLHSKAHELWSLRMGSSLEDRPRYTPSTTFETFPLPWPPGTEPSEADSPAVRAIADAARSLVSQRDAWLNPFNATPTELQKRTLTKLYNERPTWLDMAHNKLDAAVYAAYGWTKHTTDDEILAKLLELNIRRVQEESQK